MMMVVKQTQKFSAQTLRASCTVARMERRRYQYKQWCLLGERIFKKIGKG